MAILFWATTFIGIGLIFWWLWKLASNIEEAEEEEIRWREWVDQMSYYYPEYAHMYEKMFEEEFLE